MKNYSKLISAIGKNRVCHNELLSKYTSIKIGGAADLFFEAETIEDLVKAIKLAIKFKIPYFVLGGGTNLLISDNGFKGIVIRNKTSNIRPVKFTGRSRISLVYLKADSGVMVNRLVRYALDQGLAGLEFFLGQPGTIGGAVWCNAHNMKAGAKYFGGSVVEAEILDSKAQRKKEPASYFEFGYDKSIIQDTGDIVLSVTIGLVKGDKEHLWKKAQKALDYRKSSQPLNFPSSGCAFRNITIKDAKKISAPNNTTSCGYLIDSLGLKGKKIGGAKVSDKHAAFIVNAGNAKARDVKALIDLVKRKVIKRYGVELREEIVLVGKF